MRKMAKKRIANARKTKALKNAAAHKAKALEVLRDYETQDKSLKVAQFFKLVGDNFSDLYMLLKKKSEPIMKNLLKAKEQKNLEESLKPIIEKMLKEHYNH